MVASSHFTSFLTAISATLNNLSLTTWLLILCVFLLILAFITLGVNTSASPPTASSSAARVPFIAERLPGPTGFAATRLLLRIRKGAPRRMFEETMNYGKIFGIGDGQDTICVIMDYDSIEEAFVTNAESFSDRGGLLRTMMSSIQERGSLANNGAAWHESREFVAETIKNINFGSATIRRCIDASLPNLVSAIEKNIDELVDPRPVYENFFIDLLHRIAFGEGINYDDDVIRNFVASLKDVVGQTLNPSFAVMAFPSLISGCLFSDYRSKLHSSARYVKTRSREALIKRDSTETSSSLVALFARYIERIRSAGKSTFSEPQDGWRLIYDFFFAAFGTVHEVLLWATLFLATRQDIQERIRVEISAATSLGKESVTYDDKSRLPIVMATMLEVLRMRPVAPMGVPHMASEDGCFSGYVVPKGSQIFPNLWGMHNDPEMWREPTEFNPDRFLLEDGTLDENKAKLVIPFSIGPRSCPGEQIARRTIFQTLITLVSRYRISLPLVGPQPRLVDEENSFTMVPDPYEVIFFKPDLGDLFA